MEETQRVTTKDFFVRHERYPLPNGQHEGALPDEHQQPITSSSCLISTDVVIFNRFQSCEQYGTNPIVVKHMAVERYEHEIGAKGTYDFYVSTGTVCTTNYFVPVVVPGIWDYNAGGVKQHVESSTTTGKWSQR